MNRAHNFSAGPAALPLPVLESLQGVLTEFEDAQAGLMEISHRSKQFDAVVKSAEARLREILNIPKDYSVLFLQGGASLQFYMSALNLLGPDDKADYLLTGSWSQKALKDAKRCTSDAESIWAPDDKVFNRVPSHGDYTVRDGAAFVHYTTNNTIYGTQYATTPDCGSTPLVADMSSDICSRPVDVSKHAVIYAGAQKNLGPSGVTVVILSPWAVERSRTVGQSRPGGLPAMLDYGLMVDKDSLYNTPNTFGIFALDRVLDWIQKQGGVKAMAELNERKAAHLYGELDASDFWTPHAREGSRSLMNVTWRGPNEDLEKAFIAEADAAGLKALKGHRSVGGIRASTYNACSMESVEALVTFMKEFEARNS
ncbi:MAG: 3-phosphoserine/phosphohydroxythreonine transaminase [Myxococcota bacterium]|nr:3-phosphoserine/phosphohydroxythreonine transaminase [Myxococcota bacterium]